MYTAYELDILNKINPDIEYRCPICFEVIDFDKDSDDEYYLVDGEIYPCKCVWDAIDKHGVDYIRDWCWDEYLEWYYGEKFDYVSLEQLDKADNDKEAVTEFIMDEVEDFIAWYEGGENK